LIPPRFGVQIVHRMLLVNKITDETGWGLISLKYMRVFLRKLLREDQDGTLILRKLKVFFTNFFEPELLECELILRKIENYFVNLPKRGGQNVDCFFF